jgi:hypothetical protein
MNYRSGTVNQRVLLIFHSIRTSKNLPKLGKYGLGTTEVNLHQTKNFRYNFNDYRKGKYISTQIEGSEIIMKIVNLLCNDHGEPFGVVCLPYDWISRGSFLSVELKKIRNETLKVPIIIPLSKNHKFVTLMEWDTDSYIVVDN